MKYIDIRDDAIIFDVGIIAFSRDKEELVDEYVKESAFAHMLPHLKYKTWGEAYTAAAKLIPREALCKAILQGNQAAINARKYLED